MGQVWEYAQLKLTRDPGSSESGVHGWLVLPGQTTWTDLGEFTESFTRINQLGSEGWEMVGCPVHMNSVFTYKAANDTWHDRAYYVEKEFWFKRQVDM